MRQSHATEYKITDCHSHFVPSLTAPALLSTIAPALFYHRPSLGLYLLRPCSRRNDRYYLFARFSIKCSTTAGSANVEVSPSESISFAAILRNIRRIILPERVFGKPGAH